MNKKRLDRLYEFYNRRELVHPDPLELLYSYRECRDREVVGLIASSLAYGRVGQILRSASSVLERMRPSPFSFLMRSTRKSLFYTFAGFKHRFTTGVELASMLWGMRCVIERYGSLYACFMAGLRDEEDTILPALSFLEKELSDGLLRDQNSLLPSPERGSACKRLNLFLRWMVRQDRVDPGGWSEVPVSKLVVPLDTHMHRICGLLYLTRRKQANMRTALDITHAFRQILPEDPVRYDFALTRLGIRKDADLAAFLKGCGYGVGVSQEPESMPQNQKNDWST